MGSMLNTLPAYILYKISALMYGLDERFKQGNAPNLSGPAFFFQTVQLTWSRSACTDAYVVLDKTNAKDWAKI